MQISKYLLNIYCGGQGAVDTMSALRVLPVWVLRKACTQLKCRERCFDGGEPEVLQEHKLILTKSLPCFLCQL